MEPREIAALADLCAEFRHGRVTIGSWVLAQAFNFVACHVDALVETDEMAAECQFVVAINGDHLYAGVVGRPERFVIRRGWDTLGEHICEISEDAEDPNEFYGVFMPIRLAAFDAVFARLMTTRPVVGPPGCKN